MTGILNFWRKSSKKKLTFCYFSAKGQELFVILGIIVDGAGNKDYIEARVAQIRNQIEETKSEFDKENLQERLAKIAGGAQMFAFQSSNSIVKVGERNVEATKKKLKEMGYSYVQFSGSGYDVDKIKRGIKESGLPVVLTHVPQTRILNETDNDVVFKDVLSFLLSIYTKEV